LAAWLCTVFKSHKSHPILSRMPKSLEALKMNSRGSKTMMSAIGNTRLSLAEYLAMRPPIQPAQSMCRRIHHLINGNAVSGLSNIGMLSIR
jgi:hypothetical protein